QRRLEEDRVPHLDHEQRAGLRPDRLDQLGMVPAQRRLDQVVPVGPPRSEVVVDVDHRHVRVTGPLEEAADLRQHLADRPDQLVGVRVVVRVDHVDDDEGRTAHRPMVPAPAGSTPAGTVAGAPAGTVPATVAEPSTTSSSYSTTACPVATPRTGSCSRTSTSPAPTVATAGTARACARSWARQRNDSAGGDPAVHTGRDPVTAPTSSSEPGPTVTVPATGSIESTYRGAPPGRSSPRPRRCPIVKPYAPSCRPTSAPLSASTSVPGRSPSARRRKPRVSPSATKHTSCESGLSATDSPRAAASARTSALVDPPSGNIARASWSRVSTASTYDWSLAG